TACEAMEAANRYFVDMEELLKRTGAVIADLLGAEAALVTSGCAAAIALGAAACLSGSDPEKIERLPDTTGMKDEILIQARQRYKYDRCLTIFGGRLVEVGDAHGTTAEQLEAAINDQTAAIHYLAVWGTEGVVPLEEVIRIGKARGVPVIVDAASMVYPLETFRKYPQMGADLVCYGAKYFGALNSTGILCGRKDLVDAAFLHSFIGFETIAFRSLGRPLKVDRQEVVAVVVALQEWLNMDHTARLAEHERKAQVIRQAIEGIPHVTVEWAPDARSLSSGLRITLDENASGKTAAQVIEALREGAPSIWVRGSGNAFHVAVPLLTEEDVSVVAARLREVLTAT
ncbi:MAG: aminotransferase class V-fold PLP-dependent enzyme, partial [Abditibacteriales bacterium]|nr:aminotransferase class V-fold PLP-dependent enzyme [Abditibacteriales bacterium]MDW8367713.1 aminotransferase class V-fold PLP-dependent enzyme [Abditibacteriales bacterium]